MNDDPDSRLLDTDHHIFTVHPCLLKLTTQAFAHPLLQQVDSIPYLPDTETLL